VRHYFCLIPAAVLATAVSSLHGADAPKQTVDAVLPPMAPWNGSSRELAVEPHHPWSTPFETSGHRATPRYDETVAWLEKLVAAAPELSMESIGSSYEGREIWMVIASSEGASTPEALHAEGKPIALVHAGIHSGEIDGKDAGMMLLRDMTVTGKRQQLLRNASLLFIPILSVDGHERFSAYSRINQRGPDEMGWRTNARNQNLNRDFAKLDTPEVRALVRAVSTWAPDLYVDLHVTDGVDWQYDITWGSTGTHGHSPAAAGWLRRRLDPAATAALVAAGHIPGPLVFPVDDADLSHGVVEWTAGPRFSNGWGDARHLPTVLVENHSLKPYDQRVFGTYVWLASVLETLGAHGGELREAVAADRARRPSEVTLAWRVPPGVDPGTGEILAIEQRSEASTVSGGQRIEYTGRAVTLEVPWLRSTDPAATVKAPVAYWIPAAWPEVIERLALHGIAMERISSPRRVEVEVYRLTGFALDPQPFEGRARVTAGIVSERHAQTFAAGSVRVAVDQPLGTLAVLLLEPESLDSFFQWGFFLEVLQRTEYVEGYVMEPTARKMLEADPDLEAEFLRELAADAELAADPRARLQWFYRRSPYFDEHFNLYPVAREVAP
jgi:hypothetical protein